MLQAQPKHDSNRKNRPCIGLALAGGGPLGIIYEIGALLALEEALEGVEFNNLDVYVGVSAGAVVASGLANGFSAAKLCRVFIRTESEAFPLDPQHFLRPAFRQYLESAQAVPRLLVEALWRFANNPHDRSVHGAISTLGRALPTGVLDNQYIEDFGSKLFNSRGRTNDFRKLKHKLLIVATNLDTGEAVKFGSQGNDHIPISKAVKASTALPGVYPPVEIEGRYYVDGVLRKALHASAALAAGAKLLFCVNPIVPFNANLAKPEEKKRYESLVEGGLPVVLSQDFHMLIHSRIKTTMAKYKTQYPDRDVVLFEPDSGDAKMFYTNVFSFTNRRRICEHAYQTTRHDLLARKDTLEPLFARHGITLRSDILEDNGLHFDSHLYVPSQVIQQAKLQNKVTNQLSDTLDELHEWLRLHQTTAHVERSLPPCLPLRLDPSISIGSGCSANLDAGALPKG